MNLLAETRQILTMYRKSPADVRWIGAHDRCGSWEDFARFADFEYDEGFGRVEVNDQLLVVGDDWWLERRSHDGKEWWHFQTAPKKPNAALPMQSADLRKGA